MHKPYCKQWRKKDRIVKVECGSEKFEPLTIETKGSTPADISRQLLTLLIVSLPGGWMDFVNLLLTTTPQVTLPAAFRSLKAQIREHGELPHHRLTLSTQATASLLLCTRYKSGLPCLWKLNTIHMTIAEKANINVGDSIKLLYPVSAVALVCVVM